jgi:hypothetical protein
MFLAIFGVLISIILILFAPKATLLAEISLGVLGAALLAPVVIGLARSISGDDVLAPPDSVRDFSAIAYAASSDADMAELSRFAMKQFGETFPAEVDAAAVRSGCAIGLRLANDKGINIGFLDVYHFREDVLALWRQGQVQETTMTLDQFAPIGSIADPAAHDLHLVLGALYIDTSNPVATYHLAYGLIQAAKDYLNFEFKNFRSVVIFATIFSPAGGRWAKKEGFALDIRGDKRGAAGGGHDVYVLNFKPGGANPRESFSVYGNGCEYRIGLRLR